MNIQVEAVGPARKQISVEIPVDEVNRAIHEVVGGYTRYARIPGFRPGKAPLHLVKNRFRKEITKDVKEHLIPRGYQAAIKQEKIETVRVIEVTEPDPEEGKPYAFTVTVDVFPEFELPNYKAIRVEDQPVVVTEESIDEVVDRMRDRMADYEDAPGRAAEKSDRVIINYSATLDGQPLDALVAEHTILAKGESFGVVLDPDYAMLPELATELIGVTEGQTKEVPVSFNEQFVVPALAGKTAQYRCEILKVQVKKLPELTAEFLKTMGAESVEALRERIRVDLGRMKEDQERRRVQDEICRQLIEQTAMVLPQSEVQRQTADEVYDLVQYNTSRGLDRQVIEENKDQIFSAAAKSAEDKLKLRYILLKIAQAEQVAVSDAEVEAHIRVMAQRARKDATKLKAELTSNNRLDDVREDLMAGKALKALEEARKQPAGAA